LGKIEYDGALKKKSLLNEYSENKQSYKLDFNFEKIEKNKFDEKNNISNGFFIKNLFIDENSDIVILNYSDNSILVSHLSKSIKNKNILLGSKYKRNNNNPNTILKYDHLSNQYNLESNSKTNILNNNHFLFSHFEKITDICWLKNNYKSFLTCSTDQSIMIWNYRGDKWINEYFDILKIFDKRLNNYQNQVHKDFDDITTTNIEYGSKNYYINNNKNNLKYGEESVKCVNGNKISKNNKDKFDYIFGVKYYITVIKQHVQRPELFIAGDNKGNIYQFDSDLRNNPKKYVVGNFAIDSLSFSRNGNFLSIGFCTGNVILVEFNNNCKFCCVVEEFLNEDSEIKARYSKRELLSYCHIFKKFSYVDNPNSDISPFNSQNLDNLLKKSETENSTIKILSMNSYKTLRIQIVKKSVLNNKTNNKGIIVYNDAYNKLPNYQTNIINSSYFYSTTKNFNYNYKIKKIEIHVSEDYLIILFENNNILINKIESNIISGFITINNSYLQFYDIKIDPSGLYLAVLSDAFANQELLDFEFLENKKELDLKTSNTGIKNRREFQNKNRSIDFNSNLNFNTYYSITKNNGFNQNTKNKNKNFDSKNKNISLIKDNIRKRSSLIIYEIGTGNFVSIMKSIFVISNYKFSNDGRFLCVTSDSGCVSVWTINGEIRQNIFSVLEEMKIKPNFWETFRINFSLENAEKLNFFQKIKEKEDYNNKNVNLNLRISNDKKLKEVNKINTKNNDYENEYFSDNGKNLNDKNMSFNNNKNCIRKTNSNKNGEDFNSNEKKMFYDTNKKTTLNCDRNLISNLNVGNIATSQNKDETSYKSLYLNYENTNNMNFNSDNFLINQKMNTNISNLNNLNKEEANNLYKSSRGKIFSNTTRRSDDIVKVKNSNAFSENTKSNSEEYIKNKPNMLYSSSNLYKKNFYLNETSNINKRNSIENYKKYSTSNDKPFLEKQRSDDYEKNSSSYNYLINYSKKKMVQNVFPDPDDIDDLVEENFVTPNDIEKIKNKGLNEKFIRPIIEQNLENVHTDNSKFKGSTADQIEYYENNINNFESNILKRKSINNNDYNPYLNNFSIKKDNFNKFNNNDYNQNSFDNDYN